MKRFIVFFFVAFIAITSSSQTHLYSKVELIKLYAQEWGFLTYYTAAASENERDWFNFLVQSLKELDKAGNQKRFKELSDTLLSKVRIPDKVFNPNWQAPENDTLLNPNQYEWMNDSLFDESSRLKFNIIKQNPVLYPSCFRPMRYLPNVFADTALYMPLIRKTPFVNNGYGALAGFIVFWNATNYYCGHPIGRKYIWDDLLDEFIPKFLELKFSGKELNNQYRDLLQEAISRLEDSHASKIKFVEGFQGYIQVDYIDSVCYVTKIHPKLLEMYRINPGDAIIEKDGILMTDIHDNLKKYFAGSHPLVTDRNMLPYLLTFTRSDTHLHMLKPDKTVYDVDVKLTDIQNLKANDSLPEFKNRKPYDGVYSTHADTLFNNSIVYINVGPQTERSIKKLLEKNSDKRYFIFDFRSYPQSVYFIFTTAGKINYYHNNSSIPDRSYKEFDMDQIPGYFQKEAKYSPRAFDRPSLVRWEKFNKNNNKKVYLLCDESSQSKTESVLLHFSSVTKGTIVGRNTGGVPVSAGTMYLPGKIFFMFTIGEGYDYKNNVISGKGIVPDVYVKKDIKNIIAHEDGILNKALEMIDKDRNGHK